MILAGSNLHSFTTAPSPTCKISLSFAYQTPGPHFHGKMGTRVPIFIIFWGPLGPHFHRKLGTLSWKWGPQCKTVLDIDCAAWLWLAICSMLLSTIAFYPYSQAVIVPMQARRLWLQICTNITFDPSAPWFLESKLSSATHTSDQQPQLASSTDNAWHDLSLITHLIEK